jgi:glucosamine--fructose-6-phosphate aminotransferase (isomerizing)
VDFNKNKLSIENLPFSEIEVKEFRRIIVIGCGSSLHAAMIGRNWIEEFAGLPVEVESSSEFRYRNVPIDRHTLVVAIGQSGETADTLAAMDLAKSKGGRLLTICNVEGSQADRIAEGTLFMRAGLEIGVASTKTFVASMCLMLLLSLHIGRTNGFLRDESFEDSINYLGRLPNILGNILADHSQYSKLGRWLQRYEHALYLGRGSTYPIALEGALKLKEISYVHAEGYASGEMKHGPIALIDDSMVVVALAPKFRLYDKMLNNIKEVKARDGVVLSIATEGDVEITSQVDHVIYIPETPELLTPFATLIPLQLLAYYAAVARGCDVDQPRNLAKSVTVE